MPDTNLKTNPKKVVIRRSVWDRLIEAVVNNLPLRTKGMFISSDHTGIAEELYIFQTNIRNTPEWKGFFESYGGHHVSQVDTGFVVDPTEALELALSLRKRNMSPVGLFHTHRLLPAVFTEIDKDLHADFSLWHIVVSVANAEQPEIRAFWIDESSVQEAEIEII